MRNFSPKAIFIAFRKLLQMQSFFIFLTVC